MQKPLSSYSISDGEVNSYGEIVGHRGHDPLEINGGELRKANSFQSFCVLVFREEGISLLKVR